MKKSYEFFFNSLAYFSGDGIGDKSGDGKSKKSGF
jgi:hypothetical protein